MSRDGTRASRLATQRRDGPEAIVKDKPAADMPLLWDSRECFPARSALGQTSAGNSTITLPSRGEVRVRLFPELCRPRPTPPAERHVPGGELHALFAGFAATLAASIRASSAPASTLWRSTGLDGQV